MVWCQNTAKIFLLKYISDHIPPVFRVIQCLPHHLSLILFHSCQIRLSLWAQCCLCLSRSSPWHHIHGPLPSSSLYHMSSSQWRLHLATLFRFAVIPNTPLIFFAWSILLHIYTNITYTLLVCFYFPPRTETPLGQEDFCFAYYWIPIT